MPDSNKFVAPLIYYVWVVNLSNHMYLTRELKSDKVEERTDGDRLTIVLSIFI